MDINRLRYFRAVVEVRSIRRASEMLGMSPGALSKALKVLEDELNTKVLAPDGRGIVITDAGMRLYAASGRLLTECDEVLAAVRGQEVATVVRIATFEVFSVHLCARLLTDHLREVPVEILERSPGEIERSILDRSADLGITYVPFPSDGIEAIRICNIEFKPFALPSLLKRVALEEIPFAVPITSIRGTAVEIDGLDSWPRHFGLRREFYRLELLETALQVASNGLAAIFCPSFVARLHNECVREDLRLKPFEWTKGRGSQKVTQTVYLLKRRADTETPVLRRVVRGIKALVNVGE